MRKSLLQFTFLGAALVALVNSAAGQSFVGNTTVSAAQNMSIEVATYPVGDSVVITMNGPSNVWFAYGFGGSSMSGTYCMVNDGSGNVTERKLGNHAQGTALTSSLLSSSTSVAGGVRTTIVKRTLTGMNSDYFTFPASSTGFSIIWAYGFGANLSSHAGRGASMVNLTLDCTNAIDASVTQTGAVLTANFTGADAYQWLDCDNNYAAISGETNASFTSTMNGNYAVEISNSGCVDTSDCMSVNTFSVLENNFANRVAVFPNPAQEGVEIDLGITCESVKVILTDLSGKTLDISEYKGVSRLELELNQSAGLYLLNLIIDGENSITKPLMVK